MLSFTHMMVGAAIASKVSPAIGLPLAFASHFALDAVPHYDGLYPRKPFEILPILQLILDFGLGIILLSRLSVDNQNQYYMVLAALVAISPDILSGLYISFNGRLMGWMKTMHDWHMLIQKYRPSVGVGLVTTLLTTILAILVILS